MLEKIHTLFKFILGDKIFEITNFHISMLLTLLIYFLLFIGRRYSVLLESFFYYIYNIINNMMPKHLSKKYITFFMNIFIFIALNNALGCIILFPVLGVFQFVILIVGFIMIISLIEGFRNQGIFFLKSFVISGVPLILQIFLFIIELISYCIKPLALSGRILLNIIVGHMIINILQFIVHSFGNYGYPLYLILLFINCLEFFTGIIQAYIFTFFSIQLSGALAAKH